MSAQYAYFYLMRADGEGVREAVPKHVAHWNGLALDDYVGGPFEDGTGGLITFRAGDLHTAEQAVASDPFVRRGLIQVSWLKRWRQERLPGPHPAPHHGTVTGHHGATADGKRDRSSD